VFSGDALLTNKYTFFLASIWKVRLLSGSHAFVNNNRLKNRYIRKYIMQRGKMKKISLKE
jgi:hypothetical protein